MKLKKRYLVILIYLVVVIGFVLLVPALTDWIAEKKVDETLPFLRMVIVTITSITWSIILLYSFIFLALLVSLYLFYHYRKQQKQELKIGFKITTMLSLVIILVLVISSLLS